MALLVKKFWKCGHDPGLRGVGCGQAGPTSKPKRLHCRPIAPVVAGWVLQRELKKFLIFNFESTVFFWDLFLCPFFV